MLRANFYVERDRGFADSPLEGDGFELPVRGRGQSVCRPFCRTRLLGDAGRAFREVASGAKTDRAQLRRLMVKLDAGDVLLMTRLDRLARLTSDLLNILAAITEKKAGFQSLGDSWADTTTPHGRLMLTCSAV
jgi:DNA invertase Pin-like site-specific DNA recombinase